MPKLGFLKRETGARTSQNREHSAHCLGLTVKIAGVHWREELQWEMSLQALAHCSTSSSGAFRGPWGSCSPQCPPVPAASVASPQLRDGHCVSHLVTCSQKQKLPGGCTWEQRDPDGEKPMEGALSMPGPSPSCACLWGLFNKAPCCVGGIRAIKSMSHCWESHLCHQTCLRRAVCRISH